MIKNHPIYYPLYTDTEKFIILITGGRGCERPTQEVIMADLTVKQIKDIKVGESVMGDDGTPRKVIDTMSGRSQMYCVHQTSAEDYYVNDAHILSVKKSRRAMEDKGNLTKAGTYRRPNGRYPQYPEYADIPISEFASRGKHFQENFRGYKANSIPYAEQEVKIEPYLLGLWLGDGTSIFPQITTCDKEIKDYLQEYAKTHNLLLTCNGVKGATETLRLAKNGTYRNEFLTALRDYDLLHNKHIPQEYISNSERVRLELLAGMIDTDGYMYEHGYEITQKSELLARQIKYVADTLGFRTGIRTKTAKCNGKDCGVVYRVSINGDTWRIPCRIERKKVHQCDVHKNKDWHLSQLNIEPIGEGDWCGICLDGNQRYLHSDGTVTHNSGKSFASSAFIERLTFELKKFINDDGEVERITHNILYTRYTMTSAAISVIPEFMEKVEMDGLERYFAATKADVVNRMTGARIMFRGIKTSSGNQTAKLKSIHGITTFVVDEAEEWMSEKEFDTIMFSIRQKGIQNRIIIIMNPTDNNHFIYKKYIEKTHKEVLFDGVPVQISTHPNVLHIHTSYLDNIEHLSEQFIKEAQAMKEKDPEKYAHIFMGRWDDVKEGAIYKNWSIVNEFPAQCREVALGLDFGYGNAPTACVKCGVLNNCLYIDEQFYKVGMGISEMREELTKRGLIVYADSASPLLIQEIANEGLMVYPVDKSALTVVAGIEKCKDFDHIYVTKRSYNVQHELRNYVWDKDKYDNYINQPVKAEDHACDGFRYYVTGCILGHVLPPLGGEVRNQDVVVF